MRFYGNLTKVDVEQRMVFGYASTEAVDAHGETITKAAIEAALDDYMEFANIREMHQLSAVGTAEEASVDDKGLYLGAHIVDDTAWGKVTSGVYKGFSVGGKTLARDPDNKKIITKILLTEISLVDRPSNPEARFDVWKAAGSPQEDASMAKKPKAVSIPKDAKSDVIAKTVNDAVAAGHQVVVATEDEGKLLKAINDKVEFVVQAQLPLAAEADLTKTTETTVDASSTAVVVDASVVEKTDGAPVVAGGATKEGETVAKADGEGADVPPVVDPLTKATTALDKIDAAVASVAKPDASLEKSMYHVGRFAELLECLSYLALNAQFEADAEGDGSKVPAAMLEWVKAGAAIFKDLAKEEVDEFVAGVKAMKKAAPAGEITVDINAVGGEALAKSITDLTTDRDALAKSVSEKDEALAKLADRIEPLAKAFEDLAATNADLAKRLAVVEAEPAAPKTAGAMAVSKEQDAGGSASLEKADALSQEDITKALAAMSEDERGILLIKAAQTMPRRVDFRTAHPAG